MSQKMQHNLEARKEANEPKKRFLIQYTVIFRELL